MNGIFVDAIEIFNQQQSCGDRKQSILVQNYNLDLMAQDKWLFSREFRCFQERQFPRKQNQTNTNF